MMVSIPELHRQMSLDVGAHYPDKFSCRIEEWSDEEVNSILIGKNKKVDFEGLCRLGKSCGICHKPIRPTKISFIFLHDNSNGHYDGTQITHDAYHILSAEDYI